MGSSCYNIINGTCNIKINLAHARSLLFCFLLRTFPSRVNVFRFLQRRRFSRFLREFSCDSSRQFSHERREKFAKSLKSLCTLFIDRSNDMDRTLRETGWLSGVPMSEHCEKSFKHIPPRSINISCIARISRFPSGYALHAFRRKFPMRIRRISIQIADAIFSKRPPWLIIRA